MKERRDEEITKFEERRRNREQEVNFSFYFSFVINFVVSKNDKILKGCRNGRRA